MWWERDAARINVLPMSNNIRDHEFSSVLSARPVALVLVLSECGG